MKVIVAGISKTGTKSMTEALTLLGYKTYDLFENFRYLGDDWMRIMHQGATTEDFRRMFTDVDAVCDMPSYCYWEEILEAFPDAKVILTIRDEDRWLASYKRQYDSFNTHVIYKLIQVVTYTGWKLRSFRTASGSYVGYRGRFWPLLKCRFYNDEAMRRLYRKHCREVKQNCPEEKLLVYDVRQGWGPLCKFLGVETPQGEFPHKNKGACLIDELLKENRILQRMEYELYLSLSCFIGLIAFVLYQMCFKLGF